MKQLNLILIIMFTLTFVGIVSAQTEVPNSIIDKSNQYIISKVGLNFFNEHFTLNKSYYYQSYESCLNFGGLYCKSSNDSYPYYHLIYSFNVPLDNNITEVVRLLLDINGNIIYEPGTTEIPDCSVNANECNFPIDEKTALEIAARESVINEHANFFWQYEYNTYVWGVNPVISKDDIGTRGVGILIDANSGEVLGGKSSWIAVPKEDINTTDASIQSSIFMWVLLGIIALLIFVFIFWKFIRKS